jgi:hypothetical protein
MLAKALEQTENVVYRKLAFAPVDKLHGAPVLQIDAWNHHVR